MVAIITALITCSKNNNGRVWVGANTGSSTYSRAVCCLGTGLPVRGATWNRGIVCFISFVIRDRVYGMYWLKKTNLSVVT